jgi:hypothetical protein
VDVVALGPDRDDRDTLLAIGEVKWNETTGLPYLDRLRHIRRLLTVQQRRGAETARLLCFSGAGFTADLAREASRAGNVRLLAPADLCASILPLAS